MRANTCAFDILYVLRNKIYSVCWSLSQNTPYVYQNVIIITLLTFAFCGDDVVVNVLYFYPVTNNWFCNICIIVNISITDLHYQVNHDSDEGVPLDLAVRERKFYI